MFNFKVIITIGFMVFLLGCSNINKNYAHKSNIVGQWGNSIGYFSSGYVFNLNGSGLYYIYNGQSGDEIVSYFNYRLSGNTLYTDIYKTVKNQSKSISTHETKRFHIIVKRRKILIGNMYYKKHR